MFISLGVHQRCIIDEKCRVTLSCRAQILIIFPPAFGCRIPARPGVMDEFSSSSLDKGQQVCQTKSSRTASTKSWDWDGSGSMGTELSSVRFAPPPIWTHAGGAVHRCQDIPYGARCVGGTRCVRHDPALSRSTPRSFCCRGRFYIALSPRGTNHHGDRALQRCSAGPNFPPMVCLPACDAPISAAGGVLLPDRDAAAVQRSHCILTCHSGCAARTGGQNTIHMWPGRGVGEGGRGNAAWSLVENLGPQQTVRFLAESVLSNPPRYQSILKRGQHLGVVTAHEDEHED